MRQELSCLVKVMGTVSSNRRNCVSRLTVKRQSGHNRKYTCQFVEENNVKIEADYPPDFNDPNQIYIITGVVRLVVLVVIAAVLIIYRKRANVTEGQ
ncbi:hypothetical protein PFLUV_G00216880 [Perca fluviatilis]|uniref:Uncharacterized protein n=1 Tax=Perca fluviatilis TaxID=8168 RepID=A0A6A5ED29_PERFL|nr:hypothetical protein PFLUV_G00216880 [Perca fluviatilis]